MKKPTLSDASLQALKPPPKGERLVLNDDKVKGLALRVTSAGRMTWSLRTRTTDGKQVRPTLGTYKAHTAALVVVGLAEARKRAQAALAGVQGGKDPTAAKRAAEAARLAQEAARTVSAALTDWQEHRKADRKRPWSERYAAEVSRLVTREVPASLGKRLLRDTTRDDWTGLVAAKKRTAPGLAAGFYRVLSSFLGHAEAMGWISAPMLARKGSATLAPMPASRDRVLTDAELAEVWRATEREGPKTRAFVRLLILTAARKTEVADVSLAEIDLKAERWTIPGARTKNGKPVTLPLSPLAMVDLRAAWPKEDPEPEDKLLGRLKSRGFQAFGRLKRRIDAAISKARKEAKAAPMPPWRFHDLRRTARTGMTRLGVPRDHAEAAINHVSGRTALERTYDRHDYAEEVLAALTRWQAHVAGLLDPTQGAEVVPIRRVG